ncbi:DUF4166 domain-containing protein [Paenibacillus sp. GCM10023252]|uniref:DUF4166 domain-containing protein n=1 Tax=Paenibacillus sp. GCM10023252 TaxID=3252649 RepID=UPI00361B404A
MTSIYQLALGERFNQLHPKIQERFGFSSMDETAAVGEGVMRRIWFSKLVALPLLIGAQRNIMFPEGGEEVPFTIENYAYQDSYGRETVTWLRKFSFPGKLRRFDATMIYSPGRGQIVDYLGSKQHLAVDLEVTAAPNGGIRIRSGEQRFYEGLLQFRWPSWLTGTAEVCEWYDEEAACFRIQVRVTSRWLGPLFGYEGAFHNRFIPAAAGDIPPGARPLREEPRE